jgi:hypothetical protein
MTIEKWTSHPPQEQNSRVRIPSEYSVFMEKIAMLLNIIDLIHNVCELKKINK